MRAFLMPVRRAGLCLSISPLIRLWSTRGDVAGGWIRYLLRRRDMNISKRGYLMVFVKTPRGTFTAVQGNTGTKFDMIGQMLAEKS